MTLRCTIEIVPWGDEQEKHVVSRFDISNEGTVRPGMFGHDLCTYWVDVYTEFKEYIRDGRYTEPRYEKIMEFPLAELHDRRDGAEELVRKVLAQYEAREYITWMD